MRVPLSERIPWTVIVLVLMCAIPILGSQFNIGGWRYYTLLAEQMAIFALFAPDPALFRDADPGVFAAHLGGRL
jgi:hypothetical protein